MLSERQSNRRQASANLENLLLGGGPSRLRPTDSWIEISSLPSSSSLSSAADDIQSDQPEHLGITGGRKRRHARNRAPLVHLSERPSTGTSSQDEYDESESESDRVMTSSNEGLPPLPYSKEFDVPISTASSLNDDTEDEEDNATALGVPLEQSCFTPQPNIFSHPPSSLHGMSEATPGSYFPANSATRQPSQQRHSYPGRPQPHSRQSHTPYSIISPSHQPDHDAVLRASLSTLLSCAAAARSFPKPNSQASSARPQYGSARVDPSSLRMVPEAVVHGSRQNFERRVSSNTSISTSSNDPPDSISTTDKARKRNAAGVRSNSKDRQSHAAKKVRRASVDEVISPTLLTWVVSAGVIVVVSALSFSAGYTVGHEMGKLEALDSAGAGVAMHKTAARSGVSLRRLRWSSAAASVAAVGA